MMMPMDKNMQKKAIAMMKKGKMTPEQKMMAMKKAAMMMGG